MTTFFSIFAFVWLIRTVKNTLFYLYLWQLKEYHFSRFISHFETTSGRNLFLNKIFLIKVGIFLLSLVFLFTEDFNGGKPVLAFLFCLVFGLYLLEIFLAVKNILSRSLKIPVITLKSILLIGLSGFVILMFLLVISQLTDIYSAIFSLFVFDVFGLFITSFIVLFVQPFIVLYRNIFVLDKAKKIIEKRKDLIVIGITGSYGKTSTKEFLTTILGEKFNVLSTLSHENSEMGISKRIIKDLKIEHQIFVVEMGAYGKGGIKLLSDITKPQIGILAGINSQHISLFGSQETIIKTKYELIEALPKSGLAVFNGDNKYCAELYSKTDKTKKMYKVNDEADVWASNVDVQKDKIGFTVNLKSGKPFTVSANILGGQNVSNLLAAITVASYLGMTEDEIVEGVQKIVISQGSIKRLSDSNDPYYLDSTYSANPDGVLADLEYLKTWPAHKAIVMPCLIELGNTAGELHKNIGKKIGEICDLAIITSAEHYKDIKEGALSAGMTNDKIFFLENPDEIINQINIFASEGDVVLLESRVPAKLLEKIKN